MKQALTNKIEQLSREATSVIRELEELAQHRQMLEVRMHQIAGAIQELDSLLKGDVNEASQTDQRQHSTVDQETT